MLWGVYWICWGVCDVDSIEANVETASVSVEQGIEQLRQARRSQVSRLLAGLNLLLSVSREHGKL